MNPCSRPDTTVIVVTHNRPDTLRQALRTVSLQTHTAWAVIVVGDACDGRTAQVMAEFADDPRFLYVNLAHRCGEQALPTAAAMQLATTDYVALLNHDDLWLPDHLAVALERLTAGPADFFVARAAGCRDGRPSATGEWMPEFDRASPVDRAWHEAFWRSYEFVEPASAWVLRRRLADQVGPWRPAVALHRTPIHEWFLRAWRSGARIVSDPRITCFKMGVHHRARRHERAYDSHARVHEAIVRTLQSCRDPAGRPARDERGDLPGLALSQPWLSLRPALPGPRPIARRLERMLRWGWVIELYRRHGWDAVAPLSRCLGASRGHLLRRALKQRTGEALRAPPALQAVVDELRAARQRQPQWPGWGDAPSPRGPREVSP